MYRDNTKYLMKLLKKVEHLSNMGFVSSNFRSTYSIGYYDDVDDIYLEYRIL
ncbi:MAG: hypothetical protein KDH96_09890 [Candidatus Riesia sp.]|nr:hypothetical protein [Candidatus Riesia sp.]